VPVEVRPLLPGDWNEVRAIYAEGIATGHATFEAEPHSWEDFDRGKLREHRYVATDERGVIGWVAVSPTSSRAVYRGVVEHSVYVAGSARRGGVARRLMEQIIASTEADGIWTIQSSVFPENEATIALHKALGFRIIGRRERVALMSYGPLAGRFRDTLLLERRSTIAGGPKPGA
jgi:L-amino acid N-acyltransferase YncA